ncbi:MAG: hypothetical protein ACWGSQ_15345 [Longimicrobiales bacterium]
MNRKESRLHQVAGLVLLLLLPGMGASISVLDMMPEDGRDGIESHHHPGTHGLPHNHLICIQQGANQWVQACAAPSSRLAVKIALPPAPDPTPPAHTTLPHLPHSRAPPPA